MALGLQTAGAFSLAGPVGNGGDAWQAAAIGYGPPTSLVAPKNIGEGYRRSLPVMYYACDANFLDFFGSNGVSAVDNAFAVLNGLTNVDSYSPGLSEFPLETRHLNYQAEALGLFDLKSWTLGLMMEQVGLADPVEWDWTLHDRFHVGPVPCPVGMEYLVVQRNFDYIPSQLNQLQYSPYINDTLYSYYILEACTGPNPLALAEPFSVDPLADTYSPVASFDIGYGTFYTGLTRDDVAGLRYDLRANNINFESPPAGSLLLETNLPSPQLITTLPIGPFLLESLTNDPAGLLALYPGLIITSTATNYSFVTTTNITASFTNQPGTAVTNFATPQFIVTGDLGQLVLEARTNNPAALVALYPGLVVSTVTNYGPQSVTNIIYAYTNQPGGLTVTNVGTEQFLNPPPNSVPPPITTGTIDFGLFSLQALTNTTGQAANPALAIAQLQALYPGLVVLSATPYLATVATTNYITTLTVPNGEPVGSPPVQVTTISGIYTNYEFLYNYAFGNVMIRSNNTFYPFVDYITSRSLYGTNEIVTVVTTTVTNLTGAPVGSPQEIKTTTVPTRVYGITGDFFIEPTNWCGFTIVQPLQSTVLNSYSNVVTATGTTNNLGAAQFTQATFYTYTNQQFLIEPGVCEPVLTTYVTVTNFAAVSYVNTLLNVITNTYYPNTLVTVITTNIFASNGTPAGVLFTNITQVTNLINVPGGDFFIEPTNWCGYQLLSTLPPVSVTNMTTVTAAIPPGVPNIGQQYSQTTISVSTNHTLIIQPGVCEPALVFTTNVVGVIVTNYQETFANVVNYSYFTNSLVTIVTTNIAPCPGGAAGVLCTNITSVTTLTNTPSGDFWIVPAAWNCGYTILSVPFTNAVSITNTIITATIPPGVGNIGEQYSVTVISSYTNHGLLIQPILCQTVADVSRLREGIERMQFTRANYDSLLGQLFQPITNTFTVVMVTNSQAVTQTFQRVVTTPDFIFSAADEASGGAALPLVASFARNLNFDQSNILPGLAGPGLITPSTTVTFDKVGPVYYNEYDTDLMDGTPYFSESPGYDFSDLYFSYYFVWASYDGTTNDPVVYPNGSSIQNLQNQVLVQIAPASLPNGTNGSPYSFVYTNSVGTVFTNTITATGGAFSYSPPPTWTATGLPSVPLSGLPPGLALTPAGVLSGTPTQSGTFDFYLVMTDALGRSVQWYYSITIQ